MQPPYHLPSTWKTPLLFSALFTLVSAGVMADSGWKKERVFRDGVSVYSRSTTGSTVREVRAKITIDASANVILEAACDPKTYKETTEKYVEKNKIYNNSGNTWYNYQLVNYPVIAKRDYCLRYDKFENPEKNIYRLNWRVSNQFGPPPQEGVVRVTTIEGRIDIKPNKKGSGSIMRYTLLADPGGNIPDWLINFANRKSLPDILRQIRAASLQRMKKHK